MRSIKRICKILRTPEYPQSMGDLAKFDEYDKITSKCALGEISCRVGLPITNRIMGEISYGQILQHAGVPQFLYDGKCLPTLNGYGTKRENGKDVFRDELYIEISSL